MEGIWNKKHIGWRLPILMPKDMWGIDEMVFAGMKMPWNSDVTELLSYRRLAVGSHAIFDVFPGRNLLGKTGAM